MEQLSLFPDAERSVNLEKDRKAARSGSFIDNMSLPIHRWFRYSAGFSGEWAAKLIREQIAEKGQYIVLDPFAGSGTTLLAADSVQVRSIGWESHPFVSRIAQTKLNWNLDEMSYLEKVQIVLETASKNIPEIPRTDKPLLLSCYEDISLARLEALRDAYQAHRESGLPDWELVWLTITSILRECSRAGTAQWQYVLPNKRKAKVKEPFEAFQRKSILFAGDIRVAKASGYKSLSTIGLTDARNPDAEFQKKIDLVVTSPPYPNNYDYADATRLEMTFWGELESWSDLQPAVRQYLIRSCAQHSAAEKLSLDKLLSDEDVKPILDELEPVCRTLEEVRLTKGGRKTYHTMIAAYFCDLAKVWKTLRKVCNPDSTICFVIGDSAPYGVYVPADKWLTKLALEAGFQDGRFEKLRDRNVKWKNRKHRVPLHEGRLWIQG